MTDHKEVFENIIVAAKRSMEWKLNLILTPAELEVLVAEIERLRGLLNEAARGFTLGVMSQECGDYLDELGQSIARAAREGRDG